jgi:hypothetical protein
MMEVALLEAVGAKSIEALSTWLRWTWSAVVLTAISRCRQRDAVERYLPA